jgi:GT2 family glycosyltransferase
MEYAAAQGANYVLIANNDISVDPGMISALVQALENDTRVGIGMPKIYHYYGDRQRLWMIGGRWRKIPPSTKTIGRDAPDSEAYNHPRNLEYVPSCCLMLRGEAVGKVGGFDTGYFFYYDDWDYSARMRDAGYTIRFVPDARMWHKVSISTQNSEKPAKWWGYFGRSTVRFYTQHARPWQLTVFLLWFTLRETLKGKFQRVPPFWQGVREERMQSRISPA